MTCRDCIKAARFPSWDGFSVDCADCQVRALVCADQPDAKTDWREANPGATPHQVRDARAMGYAEVPA